MRNRTSFIQIGTVKNPKINLAFCQKVRADPDDSYKTVTRCSELSPAVLPTAGREIYPFVNARLSAENLTVDTINNVDPGSLMNVDSSEPVVVRARKEFLGDLVIDGTVQVEGTVNGVDLTQEIDVAEELKTVQLDTLTVHRCTTEPSIEFR
ncbi:hypothetical protein J6590_104571 [Homalodisca vitripennis]|nr:hypothetical protein J6590_104571 [Homalodisca vitripennis]